MCNGSGLTRPAPFALRPHPELVEPESEARLTPTVQRARGGVRPNADICAARRMPTRIPGPMRMSARIGDDGGAETDGGRHRRGGGSHSGAGQQQDERFEGEGQGQPMQSRCS